MIAETCLKVANMALNEAEIAAANTESNARKKRNAPAKANTTASLTGNAAESTQVKAKTNATGHVTINATPNATENATVNVNANSNCKSYCNVKFREDSCYRQSFRRFFCAPFPMNLWTLTGIIRLG